MQNCTQRVRSGRAHLVVSQDGLQDWEHSRSSDGAQSRAVWSGPLAHQDRQSKQRRPDDLLQWAAALGRPAALFTGSIDAAYYRSAEFGCVTRGFTGTTCT